MTDHQRHKTKPLFALIGAFLGMCLALWGWPHVSRWLVPASRYYDSVAVEVGDAKMGDPVPLRVVRVIRKPFAGSYNVSVREVGKSAPICNGGMTVDYKTGMDMVLDADLSYWTAGAIPDCMSQLQPARYVLSTCIYVKSPAREICRDSNVFTISPREGTS